MTFYSHSPAVHKYFVAAPRLMTEEQRAALRERDKVRYARKVAARKAAEEAQRAAILKGTAYEIRPQEAGAAHAAI